MENTWILDGIKSGIGRVDKENKRVLKKGEEIYGKQL